MKQLQKDVSKLTLKRFAQYMLAQQDSNLSFDEMLSNSIGALIDEDPDFIENLDLKEYYEYVKEYDASVDEISNSMSNLFNIEPVEFYEIDGEKYKVFKSGEEILIKKNEHDFLKKIVTTNSEDILVNSEVMYKNIHILAAVIFRPENYEQSNKFNIELTLEIAQELYHNMPIGVYFPYNKKLIEKLS